MGARTKTINLYKGELEYWPFKTLNKFMFNPHMPKEMNAQMMASLYAKYGKPECTYSNTRLPQTFELQQPAANASSEMEQQCKGYEFVHTPQISHELIALDENDKPKTPMFHIQNVPKKDQMREQLYNKKKRKKNVVHEDDIYTPYAHTKSVLTPSGNRIDTPLVGTGQSTPRLLGKRRKRKRGRSRSSSMVRSVDNLRPDARKLKEQRMRGMNRLDTPLSSALRSAYSVTPKRKRKKRNGTSSVSCSETPQLVIGNTPTPKRKKRKIDDDMFKKPMRSLTSRHKK